MGDSVSLAFDIMTAEALGATGCAITARGVELDFFQAPTLQRRAVFMGFIQMKTCATEAEAVAWRDEHADAHLTYVPGAAPLRVGFAYDDLRGAETLG